MSGVDTKPVRIQQRRTKGWRKPENTVGVARPSKWGNPYRVTQERIDGERNYVVRGLHVLGITSDLTEARAWAVEAFEFNISPASIARVRDELAGKNLMCFCPLDQPCHADVLLELANGDPS